MNIFYECRAGLLKNSALALGFFDGVHPGHQSVIRSAVKQAGELGVPSALVTFVDHPRSRVLGQSPPLLTLVGQRLDQFERLGVENTLMLTFTEDICRLSPADYVKNVLVEGLGARSVSVGFNHTFGRNREGNPDVLRALGQDMGFTVQVVGPVHVDGLDVSSSRIREAVESGNVSLAARLMARPYAVVGPVVAGDGRGRELGFPTANIDFSPNQLLPARGVYAATTRLADGRAFASVVNIGYRPTVTSQGKITVESHILDFAEDIYGAAVSLEFHARLRDETRFDSLDLLVSQIDADCHQARQALSGGLESVPGFARD